MVDKKRKVFWVSEGSNLVSDSMRESLRFISLPLINDNDDLKRLVFVGLRLNGHISLRS